VDTAAETNPIDPTLRGACATHGPDIPQTYLGRERYGCWHCHKHTPIAQPVFYAPPIAVDALPECDPNAELPDWM